MATDNTRDVELRLAIKTQGGDAVSKLGKEIKDLGKTAGDAAPEFVRMADEVEKLGEQLQAVDTLAALTGEVQQLSAAEAAAVADAKELGAAMEKLQAATKAATSAEDTARGELQATQRVLTEKRIELDRLKNSYDDAAKKTAEYQTQARKLKDEILNAREAIVSQRLAYADAKTAADAAEAAEKALSKQYTESSKAAGAATAAVKQRTSVLQESKAALEGQGVATDDLAAAQGTLVNELVHAAVAAEQYDAQLKALQAESEQAATAARDLALAQKTAADAAARTATETEAAMKALGIKPVRDLRAEIALLEASLETLAGSSRVSADTFEQAYAQTNEKVAALRRELDGTAQAERNAAEALAFYEADLAQTKASTEAAAAAQRRLADEFERAQAIVKQSQYAALFDEIEAKADQAAAAEKRLAEQTRAVGAAFDTLNIRSTAAINADIGKINAALDTLARNTRISGDEFDKAFSVGQGRIQKLKAELAGVEAPAAAGGRGMNLLSSGVSQLTAAFGLYEASSFVVKAVNDLESLRRTLVITTGSTQAAAQQIDFLRKVSNESGVSVGAISGEFARFSASMRAAGISGQTTNTVFANVTKAVGLMGLSSADAEGALRALAQSASKGKVSMEELSQQLGERLPAVLATTAKGMGLTTQELTKLIEGGKILADERFFSAFAAGVEQNFGTATNSVRGLRAEWSRTLNAITESVQTLSDGAVGQAFGGFLEGVSTRVQKLAAYAALLGESFTAAGAKIGIASAAIANGDLTLNGWSETAKKAFAEVDANSQATFDKYFTKLDGLNARQDGAAAGATALAGAQGGVAASAAAAAPAQQVLADAVQTLSGAQQGAGVAAAALAAAQGQVSASTVAATAVVLPAGASWERLSIVYAAAETALQKQRQALEERLHAAEKEAALTQQIAAALGSESLKRDGAAEAAARQAVAAGNLALTQEHLLVTQQGELGAMQAYLAQHPEEAKARAEAIQAKQQEIEQSTAKLATMQAEADQTALTAAQRRVEVEALKDNSSRLEELRTKYKEAEDSIEAYRLLLAGGQITQRQFNQKLIEGAEAAALLRDGMGDLGRKIQAQAQLVQSEVAVRNASTAAKRADLDATLRAAEASGDETKVIETKVKIKELEAQGLRNKVSAAQAEYDSTVRKIEADRAELVQLGDLTPLKETELQTRTNNAKAKLTEAEAGGKAVVAIDAEAAALRRKASAQQAVNTAVAAGVSKTAGVIEGSRVADNPDKNPNPFSGAQPDYSTRNDLNAKFKAGTLSQADAATAIANLNAAKANQQAFAGVAGAKGFVEATQQAQAVVDAIKNAIAAKLPVGNSRTVNVNIGKNSSTINTASQADADALVAMLRQLEVASGRT